MACIRCGLGHKSFHPIVLLLCPSVLLTVSDGSNAASHDQHSRRKHDASRTFLDTFDDVAS